MAIYALFVLGSAAASNTSAVAYFGFPNRYEGLWVILAYLAVMFIVINLVDNEKQLMLIFSGLALSAFLIGLIGVFQYFNMDFFQTAVGRRIMLPLSKWSTADGLSFQLGPRAVYATLYHTNYVGSFAAMLFPLTLAVFAFVEDRKLQLGAGVLNVLMFICLITSHSRAGIVGAIVAAFVLVVVAALKFSNDRKRLKEKYSSSIFYSTLTRVGILVVILIVAYVGVNSVSKSTVSEKIGTLYNDNSQSLSSVAGVKTLEVNKDKISIGDGTHTMNIALLNGQMKLTDDNGKKLSFVYDNKTAAMTFKQPAYVTYKLQIMKLKNGQPVISITKGAFNAKFVVTPVGYRIVDNAGTAKEITPVKSWGFKGYESLGSARGYIWSRSIPLLKHTLWAGYGPDTFAMHFPQNDYIGKLLAYGDSGIVVDKPHNMYLQTGINTGMISLLALLALFVLYFRETIIRLKDRCFDTTTEILGAGIFAAVWGYLIAGIFNDSTISVSPVFWILLGAGASINLMLKPVRGKK